MNQSVKLFSKKNMLPWLVVVAGALLAFTRPITNMVFPAKLDINIKPAPVIMPSAYKVYANEDALEGKYSLFKMSIKNTGDRVAENVEVAFEIPNLIENKICERIPRILPGQTVVVNCYPNFPQSIVERTTSSKEEVNITVKGKNIKTIENSFPVTLKGRNEFVYSFIPSDEMRTAAEAFDNMPLLACLVTPEDPIIKYFTQQVQEKLLKGETAAVVNKDEEGLRVMLGIYEATLRSHMVYSGTSGVPEKIGDASTLTQSIRLPREVITGRTGLCIELSLLYASVMMQAGMNPVIYLVPGHAYPGFHMNGNYYAIEATGIGGEGIGGRSSGTDAFQAGMKQLKTFYQQAQLGDPSYMLFDVRESIKNGAIAMELKDDNFLRQKVDEVARDFSGGAVATNVQTGGVNGNTGGGGDNSGGGNGGGDNSGGGNTGGSAPSGYRMHNGILSFAYPQSWRAIPTSNFSVPQMVAVYGNSARTMTVQLYNFPGASSVTQVMSQLAQTIRQAGAQYGVQVQYQQAGQSGNYTLFKGETANSQSGLNWIGAFRSTGNGIAGITIGANYGVNGEKIATQILNTLQ